MRKFCYLFIILLLSFITFAQQPNLVIQGPSATSGPVVITVQINPPANCSVSILPTSVSVQVNLTQQFTPTVLGCSPSTVTWKVNGVTGGDATHGTINGSGLYTAPASVPGPATVTVTAVSNADNTKIGSATVTITSPPPTCSVAVSPKTANVLTSATQQFTATTQGCTPSTVTWKVNGVTGGNSTVGTINGSGLYTAPVSVPNPNTVTIGAFSNQDGVTNDTAVVTLSAPPTCSVGVVPQVVNLFVNNTQQFTATTTNCTPSTVFWQVNGVNGGNATVGTVDGTGLYTAPANVPSPATVNVTAISNADNTKTATATVTISTANANLDELYSGVGNTWIGPTTDNGAALPTRSYLTSRVATPSPGSVVTASTLTTVQSAINNAPCGGVVEVPFGTDLGVGTLTLPQKTPACDDSHYIWIRSSGVNNAAWPTEGTRISPCQAGIASIANRTPYPCSVATNLMFKISAANGSSCVIETGDHYKITGMECGRTTTPGIVYVPVFANGNHFIIEQCYIHGLNQDGHFPLAGGTQTDTQHGVFLNNQPNFIAVKDSYISDMYCTGLCSDAQAIGGGVGGTANSGWGVYKFVNNHLEASAEAILIGGGGGPPLTPPGCTIGVNCNLDVPTDIEVRLNYMYKPLTWDGNTHSGIGGSGWPVEKNGFEMKIGARFLAEGNTIENTWYHAQVGWAFTLAPKNQSGGTPSVGTAPTALTNDFTYRWNYAYHTANGPGWYFTADGGCNTCQAQGMNRVSIHDNVWGDGLFVSDLCNGTSCSFGDGWSMTTVPDSTGQGLDKLQNIVVVHNTFVKSMRSYANPGAGATNLIFNFTYQNNVGYSGNFEVISNPSLAGCSTSNGFNFILSHCVTTYTVDHNYDFCWNCGSNNNGSPGVSWPAGNSFSTGSITVGFTNYNGGDSGFNVLNYLPTNASPLHLAGSDGKDIGADVVTLNGKLGPRW